MTKTCKRCSVKKHIDMFRTIVQKDGHRYQRGVCKSCEPIILKEQRHKRNAEIRFNNKRTENTVEEYRKNWVKKNRDKVHTNAKKHYVKIKEDVSDSYCRCVLFQNFKITSDMLTPKLIELKRKQIQSWRKLQALKNSLPVHQK